MADQEYLEHESSRSSYEVEKASDSLVFDDEISLVELASVLLRQRKLILWVTLLCTGVSLVVALNRPTRFTSSASFIPEIAEGGRASGASALAQQFGLSLGSSGAERSPQFYANLLTSKEILRQVVTRSYSLSPSEDGPVKVDLITHFEVAGETDELGIERATKGLADRLSISRDRETGIIGFSITMSDPILAQSVATALIEQLTDFDLVARQSQANAERVFTEGRLIQLTNELEEAEDGLKNFLLENRSFVNSPTLQFEHDRLQRTVSMRQELVTSIAQAFENARIEEVRNTPVITMIELPRVPAIRDAKGRIGILVMGIVAGLIFGVFLAFLWNYREKRSMQEDPKLDELSSLWRESLSDLIPFFPRSSA
jgi:uncharacterized protein involved in exopolysaccharide biosynthesis